MFRDWKGEFYLELKTKYDKLSTLEDRVELALNKLGWKSITSPPQESHPIHAISHKIKRYALKGQSIVEVSTNSDARSTMGTIKIVLISDDKV